MRISNLFDLGNFIPIRLRRKERSQTNPAIAYHDGDGSVSAGIPSTFIPLPALPSDPSQAYAISARSEQRIQVSTPGASDMVQQALTGIQTFTGLIPLAGGPMQAAINGLLTTLQNIDRHKQNKLGIAGLRRRLKRLSGYLCNAPTARDGREQLRRDDLISVLRDTSDQLKILDKRFLGYQSVTQAIAGCSSELDQYLAEYAFATHMQVQSDVVEMRENLVRHFAGSAVMDLPGTVTLGCLILADATGHEHKIPLEFCASFQQLNKMLEVLFMGDSEEARIQTQYMKQGQYDLCVDKGTQVIELTCDPDGWPMMEAGMKMVMRVIVEKELGSNASDECDACGSSNLSVQSACIKGRNSWIIFCQECKRRYQITIPFASESTHNGTLVLPQATNHQIIRNMHVQETFRLRLLEESEEFFEEESLRREDLRRLSLSEVCDLVVLAAYTMLTELLPCPTLSSKKNSSDFFKSNPSKNLDNSQKEEDSPNSMPCPSEQHMSLRHCWHELVPVDSLSTVTTQCCYNEHVSSATDARFSLVGQRTSQLCQDERPWTFACQFVLISVIYGCAQDMLHFSLYTFVNGLLLHDTM